MPTPTIIQPFDDTFLSFSPPSNTTISPFQFIPIFKHIPLVYLLAVLVLEAGVLEKNNILIIHLLIEIKQFLIGTN